MEVVSDEDARKIISEMYIKGIDTYGFNFDTEESVDGTKIGLVGYNELVSNIFTSNGIKQFEEYNKDILKKEGKKVYITDASFIKEDLDYSFKVVEKEILSNKINAKIKYNGKEGDGDSFSIVKENNIWKIDSFICPF